MNTTNPQSASGAEGRMRDDVRQTVDDAREGASRRVDAVADSIDAAAAHLKEEDMSRLSGYVHDMAESLGRVSDDLRTRSGDEMLQQVSQLARSNPALFLGGSVAIGFGLTRFARASRARERQLPLPLDQATVTPSGSAATRERGDLQ